MRLDELFPSVAAQLPSVKVTEGALSSPEGVIQIAGVLHQQQRRLAQSPHLLEQFSYGLLEDIQALATREPSVPEPAHTVLAMLVCWIPARRGYEHAQPTEMWRWLHSAVGAPVPVGADDTQIDTEPLARALQDPLWRGASSMALTMLAPVLFYLHNNAHSAEELARLLYPVVVNICRAQLATGQVLVIEAACHVVKYAVWQQHRKEACELGHALERLLYAHPEHPMAGAIAVLLAGEQPAVTHRDPAVIARWALEHVEVNPFVVLSLKTALAVRMTVEERESFMPEVLCQLREVAALVRQESQAAQLSRDRGVVLSMQGQVVHALLQEGQREQLMQWLSAWRGVGPEEEFRERYVVLANAGSRAWYRPGTAPVPDDDASLVRLTKAMNSALGRSLVTRGMGDAALTVPADGRTRTEHADVLEAALHAHVDVADLAAFVGEEDAGAFMSLLPSLIPLQAMLARHGGPVLPVSVSLRQPLPDRRVRSVQVWCGDAPFAQAEGAVLETVFSYAGIRCDLVGPDEVDRERFLDAYQDDAYDVIWVAAHGLHPLMQPDDSAVLLTSTERVSLQDLVDTAVPSTGARRLLVLNTCDSAAANTQGAFDDFGLARSVSGPGQAVVGHLWPVPGGAAVVFGALLACELADGNGFADAFASALCAFQEDWHVLARRLGDRGIGAQVAEALHDFRSPCLLDWASPALLV
ncbi:CHAT domain-containing protein (plasmid) [Streptomyces sp. NBC_00841]|uniref:CHAT domain-containing protein n=1 Tax=unclassified Streptomyces TaxID=2593676 RepID=UPI0022574DB0|nr:MULTISPECIES: CHAT domain-containing protein [unclassified Streptomyces]MCX4538440.1 CHAT domain-containing protein [Streptomyces sp. NBC_01669]WSA05728.1 CHAT domain-containing protein [Streptomyces sp. NBC_00841]